MKEPTYLYQLRSFYRAHQRMPSFAELSKLLGFKSKNAAAYQIKKWIDSGLIAKDKNGKLLPGKAMHSLRILGTVRAGFPSPAEEENEDTLSLDDWLITNKEASFMINVTGDSMIDAGILPGDVVILERGREPKNGDIVVAELDHEWTIKYFEKQGKQIVLKPANKKYKPLTPTDELKIAGVVTVVVRKYK